MYQVVGLQKLLSAYGGTAAGAAVVCVVFQMFSGGVPADPSSMLSDLWHMATVGVTAATFIFGLGETYAFAWACRRTPLGRLFPPIEGNWKGELSTNWPAIAAMAGLPPADGKPILIEAYIRARLFSVGMETLSASRYSSSETLTVGLARHGLKEVLRLAYVFEGKTPQPLATDSSHHYGAALLELGDENGGMRLEGSYWTNRNWTKGLNTAGLLALRKA